KCGPIWLEALEPIQKNGFVFGWKKCETSREAVGLNDCEFPGSGGWHTLALRNGSTLNTSIYRRTRDEGWLRRQCTETKAVKYLWVSVTVNRLCTSKRLFRSD